MKKNVLVGGLIGAMLLGALAGCGQQPTKEPSATSAPEQDQVKIGFSISTRDQFLTSMERAASEKAEEMGVSLNVLDAKDDIVTQLSHIQTCVADGYDAMIVNLVATDNALETLEAAGDMPVVFVNRKPQLDLLEKGKSVYVGSDENFSGGYQAQWVADWAKANNKAEVNVVLLQGVLGQEAVVTRTESFIRELKATGIAYNEVYMDTAEWDRAKAMDKFVQFMGTGKTYDVVVCNNDEMALGVIEAMKTTGERKVLCPVLGIDATDVGCEAVQTGDLAFTVYQSAEGQGVGSIEAAVALAKGEAVDGVDEAGTVKWIDFEAVTKDNVAEFMKK